MSPFSKGVNCKRREFAPHGSKFFPQSRPFIEEAWCAKPVIYEDRSIINRPSLVTLVHWKLVSLIALCADCNTEEDFAVNVYTTTYSCILCFLLTTNIHNILQEMSFPTYNSTSGVLECLSKTYVMMCTLHVLYGLIYGLFAIPVPSFSATRDTSITYMNSHT